MTEKLLLKVRSMRGCQTKAAAHLGISPSAMTHWKDVPERFVKKLEVFLRGCKPPKLKGKVYIKWQDAERIILCQKKLAGASDAEIAQALSRPELSISQQISFLYRKFGPDWARAFKSAEDPEHDNVSLRYKAWPAEKIEKEERRLKSLPLASFAEIIALDAQIFLSRHSGGKCA